MVRNEVSWNAGRYESERGRLRNATVVRGAVLPQSSDRIDGTVFEISDAELADADAYEVAACKRIAVVLASGRHAWVYVDARYAPDG